MYRGYIHYIRMQGFILMIKYTFTFVASLLAKMTIDKTSMSTVIKQKLLRRIKQNSISSPTSSVYFIASNLNHLSSHSLQNFYAGDKMYIPLKVFHDNV